LRKRPCWRADDVRHTSDGLTDLLISKMMGSLHGGKGADLNVDVQAVRAYMGPQKGHGDVLREVQIDALERAEAVQEARSGCRSGVNSTDSLNPETVVAGIEACSYFRTPPYRPSLWRPHEYHQAAYRTRA